METQMIHLINMIKEGVCFCYILLSNEFQNEIQ